MYEEAPGFRHGPRYDGGMRAEESMHPPEVAGVHRVTAEWGCQDGRMGGRLGKGEDGRLVGGMGGWEDGRGR
jgi:hypothetical protein